MELIKTYAMKDIGDLFQLKNIEMGKLKTVVHAGNGKFELRKSWTGTNLIKVADVTDSPDSPVLPEVTEIENLENRPKLTREALLYTIKWYRDTALASGNEAQINFYVGTPETEITVNDEPTKLADIDGVHFWCDNLFSYTPVQENSGALSHTSDPIYMELNKKIGQYIETHSHNMMSAFASGTDIDNSTNDGVQLVFGKLNTDTVEMYSWITVRGTVMQGVTPEFLSQFVDLSDFTFNEDTARYSFTAETLDNVEFDNTIIENWNDKVVEKTKTYPKSAEKTDWTYKDVFQMVVGESFSFVLEDGNKESQYYD